MFSSLAYLPLDVQVSVNLMPETPFYFKSPKVFGRKIEETMLAYYETAPYSPLTIL